MRQYHAIKDQHPDKILFFRMGDFYEMFGEDAVKAAPILGIALTSRSQGSAEKIPLAGVPYHSADRYLARLLANGEKVVVVEQTEDPRLAKGLVKRDIVEIITPGIATLQSLDDSAQPASLAAVYFTGGRQMGIATLNLSVGQFLVDEGGVAEMVERLRIVEPSEILFPADSGREVVADLLGLPNEAVQLTPFENWHFDLPSAKRDLNQHFGTATLDSFGMESARGAIVAAGAIFQYLRENHRDHLSHLTRISRFDNAEYMRLDHSTVRNLELVRNSTDGGEQLSLFSVINLCRTSAGSRRLRANLLQPFRALPPIEARQLSVQELVTSRDLCFRIRELTKTLPDLERLAGRLGIGRLSPRQMGSVRDALSIADKLKAVLGEAQSRHLRLLGDTIPYATERVERIDRALASELPLTASRGGIFQRGYSEALDQLNDSIREARLYIASLQQAERERTGIASLKVGYNQVFGYYIEVTRANVSSVPTEYIRKQTLVNAERYITPELKVKEELILAAEEKINRLEEELYEKLVAYLDSQMGALILTAEQLAEVDVVSSLADLAVRQGYCRPKLFDDTRLIIRNGRHPVIETTLPSGSFVPNDTDLSSEEKRIVILTGPNMSGKSTYLRQIGLIVIMAQIGSFVPADAVELGVVDRVFTRVGALDNLARGQSTFLVEMVETANILHNATERSLILLDEVGRGTSTFDGLSVAWSVVEFIDDQRKSRTVFATHYHELTGMAELTPTVCNFQVAVKKWEDHVVFLHKIIPGGCDDSYGIEVAKLAGLPKQTIARAKQILRLLESGKFGQSELGRGAYKEKVQVTLFAPEPSDIEHKIRNITLETMTPVQAFDFLRSLREEMR